MYVDVALAALDFAGAAMRCCVPINEVAISISVAATSHADRKILLVILNLPFWTCEVAELEFCYAFPLRVD